MAALSASRLTPLIWLGLSICLYLIASWARVQVRSRSPHSLLLLAIPQRIVETLIYLGLPYAALLRGDILLRWLGLSRLDWVQNLGIGVLLSAGALAMTCLAFRWSLRQDAGTAPAETESAPHVSRLALLWQAITLQVHWAFYRAVMIQVLGDAYLGAFAGLLPVILEYILSAETRVKMGTPAGRRVVTRLTLAALSAILYIYAGNLPLLIFFHWAFEIMMHSDLIPWPKSHTASS